MELFGMHYTQIFGVAGAITYLASYFLLQLRLIPGNGFIYAFMNMAAAAMVLVSLTTKFNIGSLIIQVSFISLSIIGIVREWLAARPVHAKEADRHLAATLFPGLPLRRAMQVIKKGQWDVKSNLQLTQQGKPADALYYLENGKADVSSNGQHICQLKSGSLIGDFTCMSGEPATADVMINQPARFFKINVEDLRPLLQKDEIIKAAFQNRLADELRAKLKRHNETMDHRNVVAV